MAFAPMNPVAIFRHAPTEGPGYFATYLDRQAVPWRLLKLDAGEVVPADPRKFAGLVFMGGPMSVNDDLPWIAPVLRLIRDAVDADVPVLGHCLGGQLMSKALGGAVSRNPIKEIGWGEVAVLDSPAARHWFGHASKSFLSFHWHGETFTLPPGAERVLSNANCENQAFALGKHLGMQCHIEMIPEMIEVWCRTGADEISRSKSPAVQSVAAIKTDVKTRLDALHAIADGVYARWIEGL
ncbi:MAG TPA: type 1 glutamine amidotransferase [Burkholderiales bacterium]|nr:type 1 glutamine amidotransferase [Burkholderiales bacterium]